MNDNSHKAASLYEETKARQKDYHEYEDILTEYGLI